MKKMYKTINVPVKVSKKDFNYIKNLNRYSADVWNMCLKIEKEYRESNNGNWIDRNELQKLTKNCVPLHAKGIHHVVHKFLQARDSANSARKGNGENNEFPNRIKKHFVTGWDSQSIKVKNDNIFLSKPYKIDNEGKRKLDKPIKVYVKNIPDNIVQVELIYRNGYRFSIKYIEETDYYQLNSTNSAAIDLGEIHSITSIDTNGNSIILTGRKLRSINRLRSKHQGAIYEKLSKCKKTGNQYNRYMKALNKLKYNIDNKLLDCTHKITKLFLDYCIEYNISTIYYGDVDSATRNTKKRINKVVGQKLNQWNHGQIVQQLENKLCRYGIKLVKVQEYYTSQKCPNCKKLNKPKGRSYKCIYCDYEQHRDIVGAMNILNENAGTELTRYKNMKYLRIDWQSKVVDVDVHHHWK